MPQPKRDSTLQQMGGIPDLGAPAITYSIFKFPDADLFFVMLRTNGEIAGPFFLPPLNRMLTSPSMTHLRMEMQNIELNGKPVAEWLSPSIVTA